MKLCVPKSLRQNKRMLGVFRSSHREATLNSIEATFCLQYWESQLGGFPTLIRFHTKFGDLEKLLEQSLKL